MKSPFSPHLQSLQILEGSSPLIDQRGPSQFEDNFGKIFNNQIGLNWV